jgi:hypothetical protein
MKDGPNSNGICFIGLVSASVSLCWHPRGADNLESKFGFCPLAAVRFARGSCEIARGRPQFSPADPRNASLGWP